MFGFSLLVSLSPCLPFSLSIRSARCMSGVLNFISIIAANGNSGALHVMCGFARCCSPGMIATVSLHRHWRRHVGSRSAPGPDGEGILHQSSGRGDERSAPGGDGLPPPGGSSIPIHAAISHLRMGGFGWFLTGKSTIFGN